MIKVLIVEDSRVVSEYLEYILNSDPQIQVIGNVSNGKQAIDFIKDNKPDLITMDIDMPIMNGLEATRIIMSTMPIPIIVVTASRNTREMKITIEALAAGALSVIEKPVGIGHPNEKDKKDKMITMVKVLSTVKVVTRKPIKVTKPQEKPLVRKYIPSLKTFYNKKIVAVGISSGGPNVLVKIFSKITGQFPYPIIVVQHITEGFLEGLVSWLGRLSMIPVHVAIDLETILPGHIYFAPDHHHLGIIDFKIKLVECSNKPGCLCPSVAHLFKNLAMNYGEDTIAMILTGMGSDGANELKMLRDAEAVTIAQDKESALVHGMPAEAIKLGAAEYIQNPEEIADLLYEIERHSLNKQKLEKSH